MAISLCYISLMHLLCLCQTVQWSPSQVSGELSSIKTICEGCARIRRTGGDFKHLPGTEEKNHLFKSYNEEVFTLLLQMISIQIFKSNQTYFHTDVSNSSTYLHILPTKISSVCWHTVLHMCFSEAILQQFCFDFKRKAKKPLQNNGIQTRELK